MKLTQSTMLGVILITDATRKTGYRQVKNLKNKFQEMAISILKQEDPKK